METFIKFIILDGKTANSCGLFFGKDCLDADSENENNKQCAIVYTKFTGEEIYDKTGLSSSNMNRDVINEIEEMINEEAFEHVLFGTSDS